MEIGDAVGEPPPSEHREEVERHQQVDEERRAAGEEHLVGLPQLPAQRPDEPQVRAERPQRPPAEVRPVVDRGAPADDGEPAGAGGLFHDGIGRRGEPGEGHLLAGRGALAGEEQAVLADRSEVRRQPVAEVDEAVWPAQSGVSGTVTALTTGAAALRGRIAGRE